MIRILLAIIFLCPFQPTSFAQSSDSVRFCPKLAVITSGLTYEVITATAEISQVNSGLTYKWTISEGRILKGQATPSIEIDCKECKLIDDVEITLEISGFPEGCQNKTSARWNFGIADPPNARLVDRYEIAGRLRKERLDNFAIELQNDPAAQGLLAVSVDKSTNKQAKVYLSKVYHYLVNQRGMEAARLSFVIAKKEGEESIELYIVPAGATMPTFSEKHELINGENLTPKPAPKPKPKRRKRH